MRTVFKLRGNLPPLLVLLVLYSPVYCQKLPKTQPNGQRAPAAIKTDGKANEWTEFAAYHPNIQTFYTLSNDDRNLYLALQAKDIDVVNRILGGGLTLTVQRSPDKKDRNRMSVTYPVAYLAPMLYRPPGLNRSKPTLKETDSLMNARNHTLEIRCTSIGVNGMKNVDTLLSVYNEEGIKAAGSFDSSMNYTLELSVPLALLDFSVNDAAKFYYNIRINGMKQDSAPMGTISAGIMAIIAAENARMAAATDFWGEGSLVR